MDSDKSKRKVILLVVVGLGISILAFIYAYSQLFGSSDTPNSKDAQFATFPNSGTQELPSTIPSDDSVSKPDLIQVSVEGDISEQADVNKKEIDWRDEIVQSNSNNINTIPASTYQPSNLDLEQDINALYAAAEELGRYTPDYPDDWPLPTSTPPESMSFSEYSGLFTPQKLDDQNMATCEVISVPSGEVAQERFMSDFGKNSSSICIGKAVANNCSGAKTTIIDGGISQTLYVALRTDGICGLGIAYENSVYINLCNIKDVANSMIGDKKEFSEWQKIFAEKPGETFASIYLGDFNRLNEAVSSNNLDCANFEL